MDREKVISALHCRGQDLMIDLPGCDRCDYQIQMVNRMGCDFRRLCRDAIAMLKEQDAVKPKSKVRHGANAQIQHFCGNCNTMLHGKPKFCSECGKGVLW